MHISRTPHLCTIFVKCQSRSVLSDSAQQPHRPWFRKPVGRMTSPPACLRVYNLKVPLHNTPQSRTLTLSPVLESRKHRILRLSSLFPNMSQSVTKKEAQQQQVQGQKQYAKDTVTEEKHASANASVCHYSLTDSEMHLVSISQFYIRFAYFAILHLHPLLSPILFSPTPAPLPISDTITFISYSTRTATPPLPSTNTPAHPGRSKPQPLRRPLRRPKFQVAEIHAPEPGRLIRYRRVEGRAR
jgi:hypothetical protein